MAFEMSVPTETASPGAAVAPGTAAARLPADCVLLPLAQGELLVSRAHAVFCRVPAASAGAVRAVLAGDSSAAGLPAALLAELDRHGFFGPPRKPTPESPSVQLQLTNACNLVCSYCCTNSGKPRAHELGLGHYLGIVEDVRRTMGPRARVAILGGEPFLMPWAIELCERIVELDLQLTMFTNGIPLAQGDLPGRVAALTTRGAQVRISLAGATEAACDALSGAGRFDAALRAVHAVFEAGGTAIVDVMLLPAEVGSVAENLADLRRRLPPATKITLGVLYLSGRETGTNLFGSRADLEAALDRVAFEAGERIAATAPSPLAERREGCSCALGQHLHVRSDGSLFTCFKMEEKVGDLGVERFADALAAVRARPHPAVELARCADCALNTLCGGGCRSENLQYTGDPEEPVCGPWRVRVLSELLAEDRPSAMEWPAPHLLREARARGIEAPEALVPVVPSRHLLDT
ncbi:MAG: radical SAM protein [Deltaproteobacteria bacterium]|nr:radical SAM protein [Deltaproteobacteria bacterium]